MVGWICPRIGTSKLVFWTRRRSFEFRQTWRNFGLGDEQLYSQEGRWVRYFSNKWLARDCRLPPLCKWGLYSSTALGFGRLWWVVTDVSGQPVGPIFRGQEVAAWPVKMGLRFSRNVCNYQSTLRKIPVERRSQTAYSSDEWWFSQVLCRCRCDF